MSTITVYLREILQAEKASTQAEIRQALEARGMVCSQPKISRLLAQIGAVKIIDENGKTCYRLPHETGLMHELAGMSQKSVIQQWVLSITHNESLVVIHTTPGAAGVIARILDQQRSQLGILGTIAGDDTIFITPKKLKDINLFSKEIEQALNL